MPKQYQRVEEDLKENSKPYKIITSYFPIEELKENLPHSSAYLVLQLSEDKQHIYFSIMNITKERRFNYLASKLTLSDSNRDRLFTMVD